MLALVAVLSCPFSALVYLNAAISFSLFEFCSSPDDRVHGVLSSPQKENSFSLTSVKVFNRWNWVGGTCGS